MNYKEKAQIFRDRFYGRQDVYGPQWTKKVDDKIVKGYSPACANIWADKCHIKLKDGGSCTNCEIKSFIPVSDETVLKHIRGEEPQMHYMLQVDGTVKFAAFDFDLKPGKEEVGHTFEDVKKVVSVLKGWSMPYGIARSTGNGFHVYFFLEEFYSARKFRSVMMEIMYRCGFMQEHQEGKRMMPETFPKQQFIPNGGLGNGIKPPMVEMMFGKERNCFVDDNNVMIPADQQWTYLNNIPKISSEFLDHLIDREQIVLEPELTVSKEITKKSSNSGPVNGSIEKVLEGCAAFKKLRKNMEAGYVPGHFEGMALWHTAMNTLDGKEWFINNVPGWGKESQGLRQLEHSVNKGYTPWTCKLMQERGICAIGTKCFDKKPPIEYIEGKAIVRTDVPETEWPEPSPIRYAYGKGEDFLQKLIAEADLISGITDPAEKAQKIKEIISRSSSFDKTQQSLLAQHLTESKIGKKSDINKWMSEANNERQKKVTEATLERVDTFAVNGIIFRIKEPQGYAYLKPGKKDGPELVELSNFFIDITEERSVIDDNKVKRKLYIGQFIGRTVQANFEISSDDWIDVGEFCKYFQKIGGIEFGVSRNNVDILRQVVQQVAQVGREGVPPSKKTVFFGVQGWHEGAYLMPSVVVDKDGVKPNTDKPVDNEGKEHASFLDFKLMSDSDTNEVLFHIKNDMLKTFPRDCVMFGLGFTMIASVFSYLGLRHRPILWFDGTTGHGKSALAELLQHFYGEFNNFVSFQAKPTAKALMDYAYQFKDALFLVDDYKGRDRNESDSMLTLVQSSYDGAKRSTLGKDGKQRGDVFSRCLILITGEEPPHNHSSVTARTITVNYKPLDRHITTPYLKKCEENKHLYSGVTSKFVHWTLNQTRSVIQREYNEIQEELMKEVNGKQNASRTCKNMAVAGIGWNCFVRFMLDCGVIDAKEAKSLMEEFWGYLRETRDDMIMKCADEQSANKLINRMQEMLMSGTFYIENLDGVSDNTKGICIGFYDVNDKHADTVYIFPDILIDAVKKSMADPIVVSSQSAGNQFKEMDLFARVGTDGRNTVVKRHKNMENKRVWALRLSKLGFIEKPRIVSQSREVEMPQMDAEGLI